MPTREFSYSKILSYATCPSKYKKRYVEGIYPVAKAKPLSFGYCTSKGFEGYRTEGTFEAAKNGFKKAWQEDGKVLSIRFDPNNEKDFRTVERGIEILEDYIRQYPNDPSQAVEPEVKFKVEIGKIGNTDIVLVGRIDGIISINNDVCIIEDKTTSRLGPSYLRILKDSLQIGLYLYAANEYGLFDIGGKKRTPRCLMNAIKVHSKEFKYDRDIVIKSASKLIQYRDNALNWIRAIIAAEETDCFPMNDADNLTCTKYSGCEYLPLRYTMGTIRENLLKNEYVERNTEIA